MSIFKGLNMKKRVIIAIICVWAASVIGIAGYYFLHRHRVQENEDQRIEVVNEMVNDIKNESKHSFVVSANELPVEGDEEDYPVVEEQPEEVEPESDTENNNNDNYNGSSDYTLISYGTISIPSISCELPVWEGAGKIELRYGAGRMPTSALAGQEGNLVIFGHRMKRYGSMFNRLGEVSIGDSIVISTENESVTYIVDEIETISPSELSAYIAMSDGVRITLITCTPTGVGSHRLLIIGHAA